MFNECLLDCCACRAFFVTLLNVLLECCAGRIFKFLFLKALLNDLLGCCGHRAFAFLMLCWMICWNAVVADHFIFHFGMLCLMLCWNAVLAKHSIFITESVAKCSAGRLCSKSIWLRIFNALLNVLLECCAGWAFYFIFECFAERSAGMLYWQRIISCSAECRLLIALSTLRTLYQCCFLVNVVCYTIVVAGIGWCFLM